MTHRARSRCDGFTLLEMLISLVLLGMLMAGLTQGVRTGLALWHSQTRRVDAITDVDAVARAMRTLLTGIHPAAPAASTILTTNAGAIAGEPDRLDFIGDLPTGFGVSRRAGITIELRQGRLVLLWRPRGGGASATAAPEATDLLRGVARLQFSYWRPPGAGAPGAWLSRWHASTLPALIRMRLGFPEGDRRRWPDLIAAPRFWTPAAAAAGAGG